MSAGKFKIYEAFREYLGDGTADMDLTTNMKGALFLSTSNANTLSNSVYGDLTNEHSNANGYTTGGVALTGETYTHSGATATFDCDDTGWTASGGSITGRYVVFYVDATVNGIVKPLICVCVADTTAGGTDVTATSGNPWPVTINASGVFTVSGGTTD